MLYTDLYVKSLDEFIQDYFSPATTQKEYKDLNLELNMAGVRKEDINIELYSNSNFDILEIKYKDVKDKDGVIKYKIQKDVYDYQKYTMNLELGILYLTIPLKSKKEDKKIKFTFS